jgi:hypothetical protein
MIGKERKQIYYLFYLLFDIFICVLIFVCTDLKPISMFGKDWSEVARIIDEKIDVIGVIASVDLNQTLSHCLFRRRRKQADVQAFVRLGSIAPYSRKVWSCRCIDLSSTVR